MTERQQEFVVIALPILAEVVAVALFFAAAFVWVCIGATA
jgi:hypothetical protein